MSWGAVGSSTLRLTTGRPLCARQRDAARRAFEPPTVGRDGRSGRRLVRRLSSSALVAVWCLGTGGLLLSTACARPPDGPTVELLRVIALGPAQGLPLGLPAVLTIGDDGSFFVADAFHRRVVRYSATGAALTTYGSPTDQIEIPTAIVPIGDSLLVVADEGNKRLIIHDMQSGTTARVITYPGSLHIARGQMVGRRLWLSAFRPGTPIGRTTGLMWRDLTSDSTAFLFRVPPSYHSAIVARLFGAVSFSIRGDRLIASFVADRWLYRADLQGHPTDSIEVPNRRRRGIPANISRRLEAASGYADQVKLLSLLGDVHILDNGTTVLVHYDNRLSPGGVAADAYVTVVATDFRSACVDGRVEGGANDHILSAVRGDTLFVLRAADAADDHGSQHAIAAYRLSTSACTWLRL